MVARDLGSIVFGLLLAGIGVMGGFYAAHQGDRPAEEVAATGPKELTAQTLANLGVRVEEVQLTDFVATRRVQAEVVNPPANERSLVAPLGGVIESIAVVPGALAEGRAALLTLLRDPIPRPELAIVGPILSPVGENVHGAVAAHRTAATDLSIAERELRRAQELNAGESELPLVPRQRMIDLENGVERARQSLTNAQSELFWHGVDPESEVDHEHRASRLWIRALEHDGLWDAHAARILARLPAEQAEQPWTIALLGEMVARGVSLTELDEAVVAEGRLGERFAEAGSLLLEGHSVAAVRALAAEGALDPVVRLKVPAGRWDVAAIDVRVGQRVARGDRLLLLHDPQRMWLRLRPLGDEITLVSGAMEEGAMVRATPLIPGSGPDLGDLRIDRMPIAEGATAYLTCTNEQVAGGDGFRSWRLREGLRYVVHLPAQRFEQRFVLPATALADDGPDRVVFLQDGATFRASPVHVEYEDGDVVVIANDGALFPGEPVAVSGAFALRLALQLEGGAVDPHAGHNHPH